MSSSLARFTRRAVIATALAIATAASPARAEVPVRPARASVPVSSLLRDDRAIAEWIEQRHHEVRAAEARVAQAHADVGAARLLLPNPQLDFTLSGIGVGKPNPTLDRATRDALSFAGTASYSVGITQTIELGKRGPRVDAAELRLQSSGKAYLDALGDRVADARAALAKVAHLKARMTLLEDTLTGSKRVADLQKARLDRGAVSGNDYDRLLLDNIGLEADIARGRADLEGALPAGAAALTGELDKRPDVMAARFESFTVRNELRRTLGLDAALAAPIEARRETGAEATIRGPRRGGSAAP